MLKVYLVSVGLGLITSWLDAYSWKKIGMKSPNFLVPGILSLIPVIQWLWILTALATLFASRSLKEKVMRERR